MFDMIALLAKSSLALLAKEKTIELRMMTTFF